MSRKFKRKGFEKGPRERRHVETDARAFQARDQAADIGDTAAVGQDMGDLFQAVDIVGLAQGHGPGLRIDEGDKMRVLGLGDQVADRVDGNPGVEGHVEKVQTQRLHGNTWIKRLTHDGLAGAAAGHGRHSPWSLPFYAALRNTLNAFILLARPCGNKFLTTFVIAMRHIHVARKQTIARSCGKPRE